MKPIKTLGLAVVAALLAMAFAGASSAMAEYSTALCKIDPHELKEPTLVCPEENLITHVHEETLKEAKAKLLTSTLNVECKVLFLGDVLGGGLATAPKPLIIHGELTYSECNSGCTLTEENGPGLLEVLKLGHELAHVVFEYLPHLNCSGFINCRYTGEGLVAHALGPLLSELLTGNALISEQTTTKESGVLCPKEVKLDLDLHPLEHTYIAS